MVRAGFLILLVGSIAQTGFAADQPNCEAIQTQCGQAGFTRDMPDGKDLISKCFQPILKGQKVDGVSADSEQIKKCLAELKQKPAGKKHRHS